MYIETGFLWTNFAIERPFDEEFYPCSTTKIADRVRSEGAL